MSPNKCLNKITKPPVWDGQGPYKDCRATDDDDDGGGGGCGLLTCSQKPTAGPLLSRMNLFQNPMSHFFNIHYKPHLTL
jgi:hypothetical protein